MMEQMVYPDEILRDLMANFTNPNWLLLQILAGEADEGQPIELSLKDLNERVDISPQNFRAHVALLNGANAVALITGVRDQRAKVVSITSIGLKMLELRRG